MNKIFSPVVRTKHLPVKGKVDSNIGDSKNIDKDKLPKETNNNIAIMNRKNLKNVDLNDFEEVERPKPFIKPIKKSEIALAKQNMKRPNKRSGGGLEKDFQDFNKFQSEEHKLVELNFQAINNKLIGLSNIGQNDLVGDKSYIQVNGKLENVDFSSNDKEVVTANTDPIDDMQALKHEVYVIYFSRNFVNKIREKVQQQTENILVQI